ncbi:succinyl-coa synthetase beta chain [Anaeramoeba flamelloides]|uniref:Succinate--CoA ligase [ADP-forming] subunit beta, mitochondrial n=1 Tax=Anaeramoeba flamelloides TaxID=1746091 RepID=A0AAV7Y826_9EUKA|nr:succinyl-coa synthetase beta chain [Anaeramoeba flamelloides]
MLQLIKSRFQKSLFNLPKFSILKRNLNLHEWQSKTLMQKHDVAVESFKVADSAQGVYKAIKGMDYPSYVIKSQIFAGGRGRGHFVENGFQGGVRFAKDAEEGYKFAKKMLGNHLVTKQTDEKGKLVRSVMISQCMNIKRELYFAVLMDRVSQGPMIMVSPKGGTSIEEVAEETPDLIARFPIDVDIGPTMEQKKKIAEFLEFNKSLFPKVSKEVQALYDLFIATDSSLVEINPFAETKEGDIFSLDAKFNFDDNAFFRQKEIFEMADKSDEDPRETEATKMGSSYVGLDGNIGCMVNGAGLAMATLDVLKMYGGEPANFLDLGGGASKTVVIKAFKILASHPNVKTILVNIFGGIVRCDMIANGILDAVKEVGLDVPLVVRLAGTNVEKGIKLMNDSGLPIITASNLGDAARKAVKTVKSFVKKKLM